MLITKCPRFFYGFIASLALLSLETQSAATQPSPAELAEAARWIAARFGGAARPETNNGTVVVQANNDPVQVNARNGRALRLAGQEYHRGLFCHAPSKLLVRLPKPGRAFTAVIGVDGNDQTRPGRGSVVFRVSSAGKELFRSEVLREGARGVPVAVTLAGATELILEVGDAGDGIGCDQADWAEAQVTLEDGQRLWLGDRLLDQPNLPRSETALPFSFVYDGKSSSELLKTWTVNRRSEAVQDAVGEGHGNTRTRHTLVYNDPQTKLSVRCEAVEYADFPTVEWTVFFKNQGSTDTPVLTDIQALDASWERYGWPDYEQTEFFLHHHTGSPCTATDYQPHVTRLGAGASLRFAPPGGRSSDSVLPYFNLAWPSEGVILAIGWPGQWCARFERDRKTGLRVRAGQETTRLRLHPGEEIRTPLVVLQFWKGDHTRAQNLWRRWMLAHNLPRPGGQELRPQLAACSSHQYGEMINANEENQKMFVDRYLKQGLKLDYWWMDAGWYTHHGGGWPRVGTWVVDTNRFPKGLRAITDYARAQGVRSIVWFEPERVTPGTWLYDQHPGWLLGKGGGQKLLNLGEPAARQWLTEHVDGLIRSQGIDFYRHDFNMDPLPYWKAHDAEDRQGITENHYISGFLAYWDALRQRHAGLMIDTCASGGRRNDVETLRRSVPLLRSDYLIEPASQQNHTYGIAGWIPFYGTGINSFDPYTFRSQMCPHSTACYDMRNEQQDFAALRRRLAEWREISPFYLADFYPLTGYVTGQDAWIGWQFDRPEDGAGVVQVFRRAESIYEAARFRLRGLEPEATYRLTNIDTAESREATGLGLMQEGLTITLRGQPDAVVITYKKMAAAGVP